MKNNKLERTIFILLRVLGVLTIITSLFAGDGVFVKKDLLVFMHKTIIGNVFMISPIVMVAMIVTIIIYLIFIRLLEKHISISKKSR